MGAIARNPLDKYGILYVNEIVANIDTFTVQIEDSFVEDNTLTIDIIEEWSGNGINTEGIFLINGDAEVFDYFLVHPPTTWAGELYANGGIHADKPNENFFSFLVEDNTGDTSISGLLTVDGGVFVEDGTFTIAAGSGETTVRDARFNANGGIAVNDDAFTVNPEGDVYIDSTLHILQDVILGDSTTEDFFVRRIKTDHQDGGDTIISAQDGVSTGGNLWIVPGYENDCTTGCRDGSIFVGSVNNDNVRVKRPQVSADGSMTTFQGQTSPNSEGGDGGDLIVIPGLSGNGNHGSIYFGTNEDGLSDFDLTIGRPSLVSGAGGDTFFKGQSTQNGDAGDLNILSGQGPNGSALRLIPGDANGDYTLEEQGDIILGNPDSADLSIVRSESNVSAGPTFFVGQESTGEEGGDVFLAAGSAHGNGNGGNLYLAPGSNPESPGQSGVPAGDIFIGDLVENLVLTRQPRDGGGLDTYIVGQNGTSSQGGDVFLTAGSGGTFGGTVSLRGGSELLDTDDYDFAFPIGGDVIVESGTGAVDGGDILLTSNIGGSVSIETDDINAGSIFINAGSGSTLGDVQIGDTSAGVLIADANLVIENSYLEIQEGAERIIFRADPTNILEYNGKTILRSVSDYPVPVVPSDRIEVDDDLEFSLTALRMAQLQNSLEILVNALSQCQHGLFRTLDEFGVPDSCEAFTTSS